MTIVPDTKDWTWVLQRECPECGFDASIVASSEVAGLIRDNSRAWQDVFDAKGDLRARPRAEVWSPLEYGCHVRDVFTVYHYRLGLMLTEDDPHFPNWDQDETALSEKYAEQDPDQVIVELRMAAETLAAAFARLTGDQWHRTGNRSDGARFTVDTLARYMVHDPIHHLHDATKAY
jgi:hypothetical protein